LARAWLLAARQKAKQTKAIGSSLFDEVFVYVDQPTLAWHDFSIHVASLYTSPFRFDSS
jgi:hypothetical protein